MQVAGPHQILARNLRDNNLSACTLQEEIQHEEIGSSAARQPDGYVGFRHN
jgi:hypothetical protein